MESVKPQSQKNQTDSVDYAYREKRPERHTFSLCQQKQKFIIVRESHTLCSKYPPSETKDQKLFTLSGLVALSHPRFKHQYHRLFIFTQPSRISLQIPSTPQTLG